MATSNYGVSYAVTITAENLAVVSAYGHNYIVNSGTLNPPVLKLNRSYSERICQYPNNYPSWAFGKVSEPKYDGVAEYTGQPSNNPDKISEHHFIGIMRTIELITDSTYTGLVSVYTNSIRPIETA